MEITLDIINLSVGHHEPLLHSINLQAKAGELIVLSGENGSGKSTFLKTLAGLIPTLAGDVQFSGTPLSQLTPKALALRLAYASTNRIKEDYICIEDVVRFGQFPYLQNNLEFDKNEEVDKAIKLMGIENIRHKYLNKVSDGEWQKANIARTLAQNTKIILMDEPSAFLDYPSRVRLFRDLKSICETQNKTIIVSTHDLETAKDFVQSYWHIDEQVLSFQNTSPIWRI